MHLAHAPNVKSSPLCPWGAQEVSSCCPAPCSGLCDNDLLPPSIPEPVVGFLHTGKVDLRLGGSTVTLSNSSGCHCAITLLLLTRQVKYQSGNPSLPHTPGAIRPWEVVSGFKSSRSLNSLRLRFFSPILLFQLGELSLWWRGKEQRLKKRIDPGPFNVAKLAASAPAARESH